MIEHSGKERQKLLEVIRRELKVAGIDIRRFVPAWASSRAICEVVLDELLHALQPAVHEGFIPPYGSAMATSTVGRTPLACRSSQHDRTA